MEKLAVERSIWIAVPLERAWQAVSEAAQLERWYAVGCLWEIPVLERGAAVKFYNTPTEILHATIEVLEPPYRFGLRWERETPDAPFGLLTTFSLQADAIGTRVTITEVGYEAMPEAEQLPRVEMTDAGYGLSLDALKTYLEGKPMPY